MSLSPKDLEVIGRAVAGALYETIEPIRARLGALEELLEEESVELRRRLGELEQRARIRKVS